MLENSDFANTER